MISLIPKRKLAHSGIHVLGGLAVDPLYQGVLVVGLHNFSSTRFPLQPNKKLIAAMFYKLSDAEIDREARTPEEITDFPDELIALIRSYKPVEINGLGDRVADLSKELAALKLEILSDKDWREDFKRSLAEQHSQVKDLLNALNMEQANRKEEDEKIKSKLENMAKSFFALGLAKSAVVCIILILLGAIADNYLPKSIHLGG